VAGVLLAEGLSMMDRYGRVERAQGQVFVDGPVLKSVAGLALPGSLGRV